MKYTIKCNGRVIAAFVNESDRDLCLDVLAETYEDGMFEAATAKGGAL